MLTELQRHNAEQQALRELNRVFAGIFKSRASYHWYSSLNKKNKSREQDRYFYTADKVEWKGSERYLSGVYRYNAGKREWTALKKAGHAKKRAAMDRALKLREKEKDGITAA